MSLIPLTIHNRHVSCLLQAPRIVLQRHASSSAPEQIWHELAHAAYERRSAHPDLSRLPAERVRNFAIIAHIDSGKSTLSDRLLEMTGTIPLKSSGRNLQVLDKLKVERERGITVKANTASMLYARHDGEYLLNLIDTPGHVDFASEVHRSLLACQGAVLLVDATAGIQAQTLAVFNAARNRANITSIIGVVNKVDLPHADADTSTGEVANLLQCKPEDVLQISAKTGKGIENVLDAIVDGIPPPAADISRPFKALVFDSFFDAYRGIVSLVAVLDGRIAAGDKVCFRSIGERRWDVSDVGMLYPDSISIRSGLGAGQVGYITCAMRDEADAQIGDIIHAPGLDVERIQGFEPLKPVVYASFHPLTAGALAALEDAIKRLILTDRSISCEKETSAALGQGFRLGFLGALHMDVVKQRLSDEYDADVIVTRPFVPCRVLRADGHHYSIPSPQEWPDKFDFASTHPNAITTLEEPVVEVTINVPDSMTGPVMSLCMRCRAEQIDYAFPPIAPVIVEGLQVPMACLTYIMPLSALVTTFHSRLQSEASGYATFTYQKAGFAEADLVKIVLQLQGQPIEALSMVVHSYVAKEARRLCERVKQVLERSLVQIHIRAYVDGRVIAKESLDAYRKDVLAGITGKDRKRKHLSQQKEGLKQHRVRSYISLAPSKYSEILRDNYHGIACAHLHFRHFRLHGRISLYTAPSRSAGKSSSR